MLTRIIDLNRDEHDQVHARLLALLPGWSGAGYGDWLDAREPAFCAGVQVAMLDPLPRLQERDQRTPAGCDRRRQRCPPRPTQGALAHRGRTGDPSYGIRTALRAGIDRLTDKQRTRLTSAFEAYDAHVEV